jgi:hypothetical protein
VPAVVAVVADARAAGVADELERRAARIGAGEQVPLAVARVRERQHLVEELADLGADAGAVALRQRAVCRLHGQLAQPLHHARPVLERIRAGDQRLARERAVLGELREVA